MRNMILAAFAALTLTVAAAPMAYANSAPKNQTGGNSDNSFMRGGGG